MGEHTTGTPLVGPVDEPPKDGAFRDWDGVQLEPGVIADGNRLGLTIDPDDDEDNGLDDQEAGR